MKIIRVDKFGREGPGHDDVLVASGIKSLPEATVMLKALLEYYVGTANWYELVDDDYALKEFTQ